MKITAGVNGLLIGLALAMGAIAMPAYAQINVQINIGPPAPQEEVVPTLAPGYVWAPGYWAWTGERHAWVRGRPILQRAGYRWEPDRWEQHDRVYVRKVGHWETDRNYKPAKVKKIKYKKEKKDHDNGGHGHSKKHKN